MTERLPRIETMQPIDVSAGSHRIVDRRPFTLDEVEVQSHRGEGQQQIREEDGGVDVDRIDWLQRDGDGELRLAANLEQRISLPERAIFGHVPAGLSHEPDGRGIDRLTPARTQESIVHSETSVRASEIRSSSQSGLNRMVAPRDLSSCCTGSGRSSRR